MWVSIFRPVQADDYDIFIWDGENERAGAEGRNPNLRMEHLTSMQQKLIQSAKEENYHIGNIWLGRKSGIELISPGESVRLSGEYVRSLVTRGWNMPLPWTNEELVSEELVSEGWRFVQDNDLEENEAPQARSEAYRVKTIHEIQEESVEMKEEENVE